MNRAVQNEGKRHLQAGKRRLVGKRPPRRISWQEASGAATKYLGLRKQKPARRYANTDD